ncbi:unnamed protein product [Withania somnifera]
MATGQLFSKTIQALFYNYKQLPVQQMLDFDFLCRRETPFVAGIITPVHSMSTADVFINLSFFRSASTSSMTALKQPTIRIVAIMAEGVPESDTKQLIDYAKANNKVIDGPATVGGIQAGAFKIGDIAGTIDNIIQCKLYRPGSVGFVSKSGGMSNELYSTIARVTDGGATIGGEMESAQAKNQAVKEAGAVVPISYEAFEGAINETFQKLIEEGKITPVKEMPPPQIPEDLNTAVKSGKVWSQLILFPVYPTRESNGMLVCVPMSTLVEQGYGVGDVVALLWFKHILPRYCSCFIDICIMMCADHGPCASGAHNSIVAARAGKDQISCLVSRLLTIGPRFGGAIDDAARYFKDGLAPSEFVEGMKKKGICVPGISHRVKREDKRDKRVELLQHYARENFPSVKYMEYAVQVETYTFSKANNLILNIDGAIGSLFLDLLEGTGMFTKQEIDEIVEIGYLNGLFVLARSIGLIGHTFDQKRLKQPLYRHPWEDLLYTK